MLVEYLLLGGLGSLAGAVLSIGGAWLVMREVFNQTFVPAIIPVLVSALAMTGLAIAIGLLTGREVFRSTPMALPASPRCLPTAGWTRTVCTRAARWTFPT